MIRSLRTPKTFVLAAFALAAVAAPVLALAQEEENGMIDPRPKFCTTDPVALDALLALGETAATPEAETGLLPGKTEILMAEIPAGTPADEETAKSIQDAELIYASCYNKGDFLRAAALLTPRGQATLAALAADPGVAALFATPEPLKKDQRIPGIAVENIQTFEDGTAGAVVTWGPGDPRQQVHLHLYVKGEDGLWYIDRDLLITDAPAPAAATPGAEDEDVEAAATPSA